MPPLWATNVLWPNMMQLNASDPAPSRAVEKPRDLVPSTMPKCRDMIPSRHLGTSKWTPKAHREHQKCRDMIPSSAYQGLETQGYDSLQPFFDEKCRDMIPPRNRTRDMIPSTRPKYRDLVPSSGSNCRDMIPPSTLKKRARKGKTKMTASFSTAYSTFNLILTR